MIAQQLIRQTAPIPADLLMVCYTDADNHKFRHYYEQTAKMCDRCCFITVPQNLWLREIYLLKLINNLEKEYHTIYAASIDNPNVQFPLSHLHFKQLETFDDGTSNLYPNSILYKNQKYGKKATLIRKLQGIRYTTEDLRQLSSRHHTIYPSQPNIIDRTSEVQLWSKATTHLSGCLKTEKILLGQPIFDSKQDNIQLFNQIIEQIQPDGYFPHPRENYQLNTHYIHSHLIFEDYLLHTLQSNPDTKYHIYHISSSAALNIVHFPKVNVYAIQPNLPYFQSDFFIYIYDLMKKMKISIQPMTIKP